MNAEQLGPILYREHQNARVEAKLAGFNVDWEKLPYKHKLIWNRTAERLLLVFKKAKKKEGKKNG